MCHPFKTQQLSLFLLVICNNVPSNFTNYVEYITFRTCLKHCCSCTPLDTAPSLEINFLFRSVSFRGKFMKNFRRSLCVDCGSCWRLQLGAGESFGVAPLHLQLHLHLHLPLSTDETTDPDIVIVVLTN